MLHTDKILFSDFMRYALPVVVNEVLWGLGTAAEHSDTRSYGKRGCGGKFSGAGGKTACDSCIVWVVQRGGRSILERRSERKRQSMRKHMQNGFLY